VRAFFFTGEVESSATGRLLDPSPLSDSSASTIMVGECRSECGSSGADWLATGSSWPDEGEPDKGEPNPEELTTCSIEAGAGAILKEKLVIARN
jgi:hypothetical protein